MGCGASKNGGAAAIVSSGQLPDAATTGVGTGPTPELTALTTSLSTSAQVEPLVDLPSNLAQVSKASVDSEAVAIGPASRPASQSSCAAVAKSLTPIPPSFDNDVCTRGSFGKKHDPASGGGAGACNTGIQAASGTATGRNTGNNAREVWHCAVSLAFLRQFVDDVVQPSWTTYDILNQVVLPATAAAKCRYVDTLPLRHSSTLTFFVSYAWSMSFSTLVELLEHHLHAADPEQVFCWVDVLAINQHPGRQQDRDLQDLEAAVRLAHGTLVCLDPACTPFSRIWCLFEWWTTLTVRGLRHLVFLTDPGTRRRLGELYQGIDVRKAQATVPSDRERILTAIGEQLELVNAQLKLIFLLEPYDTNSAVTVATGIATAAAAASAGVDPVSGVNWPVDAIERWLGLSPKDKHYRAMALVGPAGCGKSYAAAAALTAAATTSAAGGTRSGAVANRAATAAPQDALPSETRKEKRDADMMPSSSAQLETAESRRLASVDTKEQRHRWRRRTVAVHFCRKGEAASLDPLVMVRSLAFQLASQVTGSLAVFLRNRFLGFSLKALEAISHLDTAFNTLLLNPLAERMPRTDDHDEDGDGRALPMPELLRRQREGLVPEDMEEEVVLLVDGVDEPEGPEGRMYDNRILLALRDQFPKLPARVRLLVTVRPQPSHILRSLLFKLDPWVSMPPTAEPSLNSDDTATSTSTPAARNWVLEALQDLLTPERLRNAGQSSSTPGAGLTVAAAAVPQPPLSPATTLSSAYAALFTRQLLQLAPEQRRGVGSLLELLLASPEPLSLHCIARLGLKPFLEHLPGWGVAFRVMENSYRLQVLHRSLLDWLCSDGGLTAGDVTVSAKGGGGRDGSCDGWSTTNHSELCGSTEGWNASRETRIRPGDVDGGDDGGDQGHGVRRSDTAAAVVLRAAGMPSLDPVRGHCLLADWVLADLRESRRPQTYSLRYAIRHLAHAAMASDGGAMNDHISPSAGGNGSGRKLNSSARGRVSEGAAAVIVPARSGPINAERIQQLDELMLDFNYWRQVYTSRLGAGVLYDLTTLPGLDSPVTRDVVRMIQRDHVALERDCNLIEQLALETPLASATRAAAVAARVRHRDSPAYDALVMPLPQPRLHQPEAQQALPSSPPPPPPQQEEEEQACVVAAPVHPGWSACLVEVRCPEIRYGRPGGVSAVRFSPDGSVFAAANNHGTVLLHDSATGERMLRLQCQADYVTDVAFITLRKSAVKRLECGAETGRSWQGTGDRDRCGQHAPSSSPPSPPSAPLQEGQQQEQCLVVVAAGSDRTIRFWDAVSGEELACLHQQDHRVTALAVSPDNRHIASAYDDGKISLWRISPVESTAFGAAILPDIEELPTHGSHSTAAFCCTFSPDGIVLASGGKDGCVRLWDVATGEQMDLIDTKAIAATSSLESSSSLSTTAVTAATTAPVNASSGIAPRPSMVKCVAFTAGGSSLLVGMSGGEIGVWSRNPPVLTTFSISPLSLLPEQLPPESHVSAAAAPAAEQQQSSRAATPVLGSALGVELGDPGRHIAGASWSLRLTLRGHTADVGALVADRAIEGRTAYSTGFDRTVRVWDLAEGRQLAVLYGHSDYVSGCDLSRNGRLLASGSSDGTVRIWDAQSAASTPSPQQHALGIMQMSVAPATGYVATASKDTTVNIWKLPVLVPKPPPSPPPITTTIIQKQRPQRAVQLMEAPALVAQLALRDQHQKEPHQKPRAQRDQSTYEQHQMAAEAEATRCGLGLVMTLRGHTGNVSSVAIAPDEVTLATGSYDRTVRVYCLDRPTIPELVLSNAHRSFVTAVSFDARNTRLASAGADGTIAIWDTVAWEQHHFAATASSATADGPPSGPACRDPAAATATVAPAGDAAAATAVITTAATGAEGFVAAAEWMQPLQIESIPGCSTVWCLAWSPVDFLLAAGHNSCTISICDGIQPEQPRSPSLLYVKYQPTLDDGESSGRGWNGHVYGVAWSPDGQWLAGAYSGGGALGGHARVWDITSGEMVADFKAHEQDVWAVAFDPLDRNLFASCSNDGMAAIWNLNDLRSPVRVATLRGHRSNTRSVAFVTRRATADEATASATVATAEDSRAGMGPGDLGSCGGVGSLGGEDGVISRMIVTAGMDATVRVWSYKEALRQGDVSYICPWALTG